MTIEQDSSGVAHCFRCEYVETLRDEQATKRPGSRQARTTASLRYETLSEFGSELWRACGPIVGVSAAYLAARCRQRTGTWLAQKWGLFRALASEAEVETLIAKVGKPT